MLKQILIAAVSLGLGMSFSARADELSGGDKMTCRDGFQFAAGTYVLDAAGKRIECGAPLAGADIGDNSVLYAAAAVAVVGAGVGIGLATSGKKSPSSP